MRKFLMETEKKLLDIHSHSGRWLVAQRAGRPVDNSALRQSVGQQQTHGVPCCPACSITGKTGAAGR